MICQSTISRQRAAIRLPGILLALGLLALGTAGCNGLLRPISWSGLGSQQKKAKPQESPFQVIPRKHTVVATLSPDDVVRIMERVGFADEQILELGTDLHNALRFSGAAEIVYRKDPLALFMVSDEHVQIRSRSGTFEYDLTRGRFVPTPLNPR
jgi:hypothetical protein